MRYTDWQFYPVMWPLQIAICCLLTQSWIKDVMPLLSCEITGVMTEGVCQVTINTGKCRSTASPKTTVMVHGELDSKPDFFDVDTFSINGQPGINISISQLKDADDVSSFEVSVVHDNVHQCIIFNLSSSVGFNSTKKMTVIGKIYPLTANKTFFLRAYASSKVSGVIYQECYVRTAPFLNSYLLSFSANWMPSVVYYNDSATHTVWLKFTPPSSRFNFESITVNLIRIGKKDQPMASNITNYHNFTFFNVKPGSYYLAVYPHDPDHNKEGLCLCLIEYMCRSCVRTLTTSFDIFENSENEMRSTSSNMSTGTITRSSNKLTDLPLNGFQGLSSVEDEFSIAVTEPDTNSQSKYQSLTYTESNTMSQNKDQSTPNLETMAADLEDDTFTIKIIIPICVVIVAVVVVMLFICRTKYYKCSYAKAIESNSTKEQSRNSIRIKGNFALVDENNSFKFDTKSHDLHHKVNGDQVSSSVKSRSLIDPAWTDVQGRYLQELETWEKLKDKTTVVQSGNFIVDPDAYSILNPSIEPAKTLMEVNLEDGIVTNIIGQPKIKIPYVNQPKQYRSTRHSCSKGDVSSDNINIDVCPGSVHFISPEVSDCDDTTSQLQSEEMGEINKRYTAIVQGYNKLKEQNTNIRTANIEQLKRSGNQGTSGKNRSMNTPKTPLSYMNNSTKDEKEAFEVTNANIRDHCSFNNELELGDSAEDSKKALDSGFCSVSKHLYDNISYGGVSF